MKINKYDLIYLASAYSFGAKTEKDLEKRYNNVLDCVSKLIQSKIMVYSPIVHNHPINKTFCNSTPGWDFWKKHDLLLLKRCDYLFVLLDDEDLWKKSVGVQAEIKFAKRNKIPVYAFLYNTGGFTWREYDKYIKDWILD